MKLAVFDPQGGEVVSAIRDGDHWKFIDDDGLTFTWLGDLRLDKAHKLLHSLVMIAGRIGINEYDFLRLQASKGP